MPSIQDVASGGAATIMNCACLVCQGKSGFARADLTDIVLADASGIVKSSLSLVATTSDATVPGSLSGTEDGDVIAITLQAGTTYSFAYRPTATGGIEDPLLAVFDAAFNLITLDDDGGAGRSSLITFTPTTSGTYYLYATSFLTVDSGNPALDTGNYTIDVWTDDPAVEVPGTIAGAVAIAPGTTFGHIETPGDSDVYKVEVKAGQVYTFGFSGGVWSDDDFDGEPGEVVARLDLLDASGRVIATNLNYESATSYFAKADGAIYVRATSFAGTTGGYTLDVTELNPADFDPLDSINWVNAQNVEFVNVAGVPTAYVYFGDSDENFGQTADDGVSPMITIDWNAYEKQQVMLALEDFERILGVNYEITTDISKATFRLLKTEAEDYGAYFFPQDPVYGPDQGVGVFNVLSGGWNLPGQTSLEEGGYSFSVILHEFGHAHGLSHPHDRGGGSDIMLAVTAATGALGVFDLNQGIYTVMSYNDAWTLHPDGPSSFSIAGIDNGWSATLSAFDIAVLQQRYGVVARNTGNDVYALTDVVDDAFYQTIWDSGGTDEIAYGGARNAQIDLTAATLDYTPTGGGVVSFLYNLPGLPGSQEIKGGYTIANGVVIENASGGSGNDVLIGNDAANVLKGNGGDDFLQGRGGKDRLEGGAGFDTASFATSLTGVKVSIGNNFNGDSGEGDTLISIEKVEGSNFDDDLDGGNSADTLFGLGGNDKIVGGNAADTLDGGDGNDLLEGGNDNDTLRGGAGDDRLLGDNGNDILDGGAGRDDLSGGNGVDVIAGGAGDDTLRGGNGNDRFLFGPGSGTDTIADYKRGDLIDLSALAGVDRSDLTITGNRIFVENGDDDLTIIVQGDRITDAAFVFAAATGASAAAQAMFAQEVLIG